MPIPTRSGTQNIQNIQRFNLTLQPPSLRDIELSNAIKSQVLPIAWQYLDDWHLSLAMSTLVIILHRHGLIHHIDDEFCLDNQIQPLFTKLFKLHPIDMVRCISILQWLDLSGADIKAQLIELSNQPDEYFLNTLYVFEFFFLCDSRLNIFR